MRKTFAAATLLALVLSQAGCSYLPERPSWARWSPQTPSSGLPSPDATIAATEPKPKAKRDVQQASADDADQAEISRAKSLGAAGKSDKARKIYEEVLKRNPANV